MDDPDRTDIADLDGLVAFFRDLPPKRVRRSYQGVAFEVSHLGGELFLAASAAGGLLAGAVVDKLRARPHGTFARLWYPRAAGLDLVVSPRGERAAAGFEASYALEALVPALAARFLGSALPKLLSDLWPRYHIELRDAFLDVGPLDGAPRESADAVSALVGALTTLPEPAPRLPEDAAHLDSFCFYCGHPVASGTPTCPECGGDLRA